MRFPEQAREGSPAHVEAVRRLDQARLREGDMRAQLDAVRETHHEPAAAAQLAQAKAHSAAREAWVAWIERGY